MYHATPFDNLGSIVEDGIKRGLDGVYLCKTPEDCCKFLLVRLVKHILVCRVDLKKLKPDKLEESFDHSEAFFKCRAWVYADNIPKQAITQMTEYTYE
jgi:hypothetical protein